MPVSVDIVSDVVCPFCFIGMKRVEDALAAEGIADAEVTFHPFLLDPSTPPEGVDLRASLRAKYGGDPEAMFGRVEAMAKESGIPLDFAKVRLHPNTIKAHTLLRHAKERGTQHALARALFEAHFLDGKDIGSDDVLVSLATRHGYDEAEARKLLASPEEAKATRAEAQEAAQQGIRGVPFVILGGKLAVSGAQPVEAFRGAIARLLRE